MDNLVALSKPVSEGSYLLLVESKAPWYAPSFLIKLGFKRAVPDYRKIKGLTRKAFTIGKNNGLFGGLYTWQSLADLNSYYNEERIKSVEEKRGMRPLLSIFQVLSSRDAQTAKNCSQDQWEGNFVFSIEQLHNDTKDEALKTFRETSLKDGVITDYLALKDGLLYHISLWLDERYLKMNLHSNSIKILDAPLLIENA